MQQFEQGLTHFALFASNEDILQWQAQLDTSLTAELRLLLHTKLAWHLKQRNYLDALAHLSKAKNLLNAMGLAAPLYALCDGRLALIQAETSRLVANLADAKAAMLDALTLLRKTDNAIAMADLYWLYAWLAYDLGDIPLRNANLAESIQYATKANDRERLLLASAGLARSQAFQDLTLAERRWSEQLNAASADAEAGLATWIFDFKYVVASKRQEIGLAIAHANKMFQAALASGQYERAITAASNIGFDLARIHDLPAALEWSEKGLELARKQGWPLTIGLCLTEMAEILRKMRRTGAARQLLNEALNIMAPYPDCRDVALALNYLGDVELNCQNYPAALENFRLLLHKAETLGHADLLTIAYRGCAHALLHSAEPQKAKQFADKALELAQQQLDGYNIVEALRVLAQIHESLDGSQQDEASLHYLQQAVMVCDQVAGFQPQPELFQSLAEKYAAAGQYQEAYQTVLRAMSLSAKHYDRRAHEQATALQIRFENDKAHQESLYHRKLAEAERERALSLVEVNSSLEQLLVREKQLQQLLEASHDAVITMDTEGCIVRWNAAAEHIFGWRADEIIGKPLSHYLIPIRYREAHEKGMANFLRTGEARVLGKTIELAALNKQGAEMPVELSLWHVKTDSGILFGALIRDISARKAAEKLLREQEEKYRSVVENGSEGILVVVEGRIVFANPFMTRTTGRPLESLLNQPFTSFIHPEDVARVVANYQRRIKGEEVEQHYEFRITTLGGADVWVELSAVAMEWEGKPATLSFLNDVTQRRILQEELLTKTKEQEVILQSTVIGIALIQAQRLLWANSTLEKILGYPLSEMQGRSVSRLFKAEHEWSQFLPKVMDTLDQQGTFNGELDLIRSDGKPIWLQIHGARLPRDEVPPVSLWTFIDITERKRAEAELLNALQREREFGQLKNRFVSMTSHEFRTPLTGIQSSVELLVNYGERLSREDKTEIFNQIHDSVARMTQMLDNILLIGRGEAQLLRFSPVTTDLAALCRQLHNEVIQSRPLELQSTQIELSLTNVAGEWLLDENLLRQSIGNLLANAIKYSPGKEKVYFRVTADQDMLIFEVQDQGIGIPEQDQPRLFESFHRASNVGNIAGTGLGLAIVKQATELHGGTISFTSKVNVGTTFRIMIPAKVAREP